jgi:hypothetical protein
MRFLQSLHDHPIRSVEMVAVNSGYFILVEYETLDESAQLNQDLDHCRIGGDESWVIAPGWQIAELSMPDYTT